MNRGDVLAIALASALVGALYAHFWQPAVAATHVELRVGGVDAGRYALNEAREIRVDGRLGPSVLKIEDGRVRFLRSPCRNQVCVHSGWLQRGGDAAACLPNRVSISLVGGDVPLDGIAY
ncbi:NusG domain II-containing protein [Sinimarinibacterium thermocellulolyticum]|uniref:NusG domain II-containing protein n=1 Tax=Sinimarinibacterium thermocellulolyticum TaxID=3170016 RepID=A0ABV2AA33_9GAMM